MLGGDRNVWDLTQDTDGGVPVALLCERLAGAPISWGVCEVPGWGSTLPPTRVLSDMRDLRLRATELGPVGYLGEDPSEIRDLLASFGLVAEGGFVPLVLHDPSVRSAMERATERAADLLQGSGATNFVTAVVADEQWGRRAPLDSAEWEELCNGLALVEDICAAHGLQQVLHPHIGTLVESADDVRRALEGSSVSWCLDSGHLALGGTDPVEFATAHADRVGLVHLKDVREPLAARVRSGELSLLEATRAGVFCSLGRGDVAVGATVRALERAGYAGWYVLEQDITIDPGLRPEMVTPLADVRASIEYLERLSLDE
ncbi:MAG TPA: sugar phosphate isomerase/epimerase [Acidimicrobiales bacterium]